MTARLSRECAMGKIVSVHSFRGGIVDTDIQSPGIHVLFNLDETRVTRALARQGEDTYHAPAAAALPLTEKMLGLASAGVFCPRHPDQPFTKTVREPARRVAECA
jgi:hypothetical protein